MQRNRTGSWRQQRGLKLFCLLHVTDPKAHPTGNSTHCKYIAEFFFSPTASIRLTQSTFRCFELYKKKTQFSIVFANSFVPFFYFAFDYFFAYFLKHGLVRIVFFFCPHFFKFYCEAKWGRVMKENLSGCESEDTKYKRERV
jgi:hypothetical protein